MTASLSDEEWRRARWRACGLPGGETPRWPGPATTAVGRLGAIQAQEFDVTLWALSQRTGQTRSQILAEFNAGRFVRTHTMRPTWHFVRREDLPRLQAATAERVHRINSPYYRSYGLDPAALAAWGTWLKGALADGPRTRRQLSDGLAAAGTPMAGQQLAGALMWAELEMIVASGPLDGGAQTYQLLDCGPLPDRDESMSWLVRTFLLSHGPSTVLDIAAWSGLKRSEVRAAVQRIEPEEAPGPDGALLWTGDLPSTDTAPGAALLNGYDEYISGVSAAAKARLDPRRLYAGRPGTAIHVVMIGGALAGHWRRDPRSSPVRVKVQPLRSMTGPELDGLAAEVAAFSKFLEAPATLEVARFPDGG